MTFKIVAHKDVKVRTEEDRWIVPGLISSNITLVYGEPKVGKSYLIANLLVAMTTGRAFLGREPFRSEYRPLVVWTDADGDREYKERIEEQTDQDLPIGYAASGRIRSAEIWEELLHAALLGGYDCLVLDNLSELIGGDMNNDQAVQDFYEGVKLFTMKGIPVIIVGHSSDKSYQGYKAKTAIGHTSISANARWRLFVRRVGDDLVIETSGNAGPVCEIRTRFRTFDMVSEKEPAPTKVSPDRMDKFRAIADHLLTECQGLRVTAAAKKVAEDLGHAEASVKAWMKPTGPVGKLVRPQGPDNVWTDLA